MKKKTKVTYSERMTVNLTSEQMRRLDELRNTRARSGTFISKNDLIRDAVSFYLAAQDDLPARGVPSPKALKHVSIRSMKKSIT